MAEKIKLDPVIGIDEEKCTNCYACITACPVKYCMDGSGDKLLINHDECIGCGHCIAACSHDARIPIDDIDLFLEDLKKEENIIAVVAPAVASVFPDTYLRLNGYLQKLGVKAFFDVSFGAELTVVTYLNYIKSKKPKTVIAQPCPAIVTYIEIYHPELIPYLAPADSPMLHTIKMIREYYPEYRNYKIAVVSPCLAKKREFKETGLGDYNVSMLNLKKHFEKQSINLLHYPDVAYEGAPAERAAGFSTPGGLLDTAERFIPGIRRNTRKIEGTHTIYPYLKGMAQIVNKPDIELPLLIDCLNCEMGCNGGPGTGNNLSNMEEIEWPVRKRITALEKKLNPGQKEKQLKKYNRSLNRFWKPGLYTRTYKNLSGNYVIQQPDDNELQETFKKLSKHTEADIFDCTACGYGSCKSMATAVFNNINKPGNCAQYNLKLLAEEKKTIVYMNQQLRQHLSRALEVIENINSLVEQVNTKINIQCESVDDSTAVTEEMVSSLKNTSDLSRQKRESITELIANAAKGQEAMQETVSAVQDFSHSIDGIGSAIKIISVIASNTNLLSMNAAIEAAHAGDAGRGFAVVADEIRRLSETTRENSRNISQTLSGIITSINTTSKRSGDAGILINTMSEEIHDIAGTMAELIDTLGELSAKSTDITSSLETLKEHSNIVKTDYASMLSLTDKLRYDINMLAAMSTDIVQAIEKNDHELLTKLVAKEESLSKSHMEAVL